MHLRRLALSALLVLASASVASAQSPWFDGGLAAWGWPGARTVNQPVLPYFAVHPPVYYSVPVPRPYGFSPFAALPGQTPVEFHYLPKEPVAGELLPSSRPAPVRAPARADRLAGRAEVIENPYYVGPAVAPESAPGDLRLAEAAGR